MKSCYNRTICTLSSYSFYRSCCPIRHRSLRRMRGNDAMMPLRLLCGIAVSWRAAVHCADGPSSLDQISMQWIFQLHNPRTDTTKATKAWDPVTPHMMHGWRQKRWNLRASHWPAFNVMRITGSLMMSILGCSTMQDVSRHFDALPSTSGTAQVQSV